MKESMLPTLPVMERLSKWGDVRLRPSDLENQIFVELRATNESEWKPIYVFLAVGGRIAMRVLAEKNDRVLIYEPITNTFSDVTGPR